MAKMLVRYVGGSTYRGLTESDLAGLGLKVDLPPTAEFYRRVVGANSWVENEQRPMDPARDLVWGPHNRWTLELDVSPELETVLREQDHFVLTAVTDEGAPGERVADAGPQVNHPGDTVVTHVEGEPSQKAETPREEDLPFTVGGETITPEPAATEGPVEPEPTAETKTRRRVKDDPQA